MKNNQPPQAAHHAITTAWCPDNTRSSALVRSRSSKFMAHPSREPRSQCSNIGFSFLPFSRRFSSVMITSIDTITQVSIKFRESKKVNKNMGINIEHNTNNTYENGDKCVRIRKRREHIHRGAFVVPISYLI